MSTNRKSMILLGIIAMFGLRADSCRQELIANPGFDLWCGETLCGWELAGGAVEPVATWHRQDKGASLVGDPVVLTQLSDAAPVSCIGFELQADHDASVNLTLELDFLDDGTAELRQPLAADGWQTVGYRITAPDWYSGLRFTVRKEGPGRAVLSRIVAFADEGCTGEPLRLQARPHGAPCQDAGDCASGHCADLEGAGLRACGACTTSEDCPTGMVCGLQARAAGEARDHRACVLAGSRQLGESCSLGEECATGSCAEVEGREGFTAGHRCSRCAARTECGAEEVCGLAFTATGMRYAECGPAGRRGLGELCLDAAECASGVCCAGLCASCCEEGPGCPAGEVCARHTDVAQAPHASEEGELGWLWALSQPSQCSPGQARAASGEPCLLDADCRSGQCAGDGELARCFVGGQPCPPAHHGTPCGDEALDLCLVLGVAHGVCR
ncbi:MAG: hypothetical protein RBU45_25135 [Myxococcota bacterium]|jgi:hypothetical protein|nr:hypothetical protein [Myxococcota bacterium]